MNMKTVTTPIFTPIVTPIVHRLTLTLTGLGVTALLLSSCDERARDRQSDTAASDTSADTVSDVGPDTTAGCAEDNLAACEYPSRGVELDERSGISTTEPETGRTLPLVARVPRLPGPLPVVIWSHGGGFTQGGQLGSDAWGEAFARHGYVVIHVGHSPLGLDGARTLCTLASVPEAECAPSEDDDANGLVAIGRSYDLKAVLDDLPRLSQISVNNDGPALDLDRVAVVGWSGGARGPMTLMGAKVKPTASAPIFTNPHALPKAAIFLSPAGPGFGGWYEASNDNSFDALRGPTLSATGTHDVKPNKPQLTGEIRRRHFDLVPGDDERWLLYSNLPVGVGGHGTYELADLDSPDARLARFSDALVSTALAFLDASLSDDAAAAAWLASDNARVLAGDADYQHR